MDFVTLTFSTAFVFIVQKILQNIWDKVIPGNKNKKRGKQYGKK